jgi:diaminopimelate decarboxylase
VTTVAEHGPDAATAGGPGPWPLTARRDDDGVIIVGGVPVTDLAAEHGTPLWVVDELDLRTRCRRYVEGFPGVDIAYASKAWCTVGILQLVDEEGLYVDVASGGELHTALVAGVDPARLILHGNNKSEHELDRALEVGVGRIVVDSFEELDRLDRLAAARDTVATVWLRITPGIDAHTHEYVRTGHDDAKFGFTLSLGLADQALRHALALDHLEVVGIHAHIGSQIFGTDPFIANAEVTLDLLSRWRDEHGVTLGELNLGGGMGIRYTHEDHPVEVARYGRAVLDAVAERCADLDLPQPRLVVEPGRAIVGPSTLTLYEVGTVKALPGLSTWVSVDGGMSDNIRPALYDAEHEVALANRRSDADPSAVTIVGKHCESGDLVREHASLPSDVVIGDLLAVAATGAYTESMASNYNRLPRPAAVLVRDGEVRPLLRRETMDDLVRRDVPLR